MKTVILSLAFLISASAFADGKCEQVVASVALADAAVIATNGGQNAVNVGEILAPIMKKSTKSNSLNSSVHLRQTQDDFQVYEVVTDYRKTKEESKQMSNYIVKVKASNCLLLSVTRQ